MKFSFALISGALALMSLFVSAQGNNLMLNHTNLEDLPEEAQGHYTRAVEAMDHIDTVTAINEMAAAAAIATQEAEIQILFIDLAKNRLRGDSFDLTEGLALADQVVTSYERLLAKENTPEWAHMILEAEHTDLIAALNNINTIIDRRRETGLNFIQQQQAMLQRVEEAQAEWRREQEAKANEPQGPTRINSADNIDANPLLEAGHTH